MSSPTTHYDTLGLSPEATPQQVKKRFHELARQYHPDLHRDHPEYHEIFVRITQAYEVLSDPSRRAAYDLDLRRNARREAERKSGSFGSAPYTGASAQNHPPSGATPGFGSGAARNAGNQAQAQRQREMAERRAESQRLWETATLYYRRGNLREAERLCRESVQLSAHGPAHEMLGDLYARQARFDEAIRHYSIAAQRVPYNGQIMAKLNRLVEAQARGATGSRRRPHPQDPVRQAVYQLSISCFGIAAILFLLIWRPDQSPEALGWPMVSEWTAQHLLFMSAVSVLTGILLAMGAWVRPADHELLYRKVGGLARSVPVGFPLFFLALVWFPLSFVLYLIVTWRQNLVSRSLLSMFVTAVLLILAFVWVGPEKAGLQTFLFGGNIIFPCLLFGWLVGEIFRPEWAI